MAEQTDDVEEISDEEFAEMLDEAIDLFALALPEDADDEYWSNFRQMVEQRARALSDSAGR